MLTVLQWCSARENMALGCLWLVVNTKMHAAMQDGKIAVEADRLPDGSIIPKGAQVSYMPYLINRMPTFWGPNAGEQELLRAKA